MMTLEECIEKFNKSQEIIKNNPVKAKFWQNINKHFYRIYIEYKTFNGKFKKAGHIILNNDLKYRGMSCKSDYTSFFVSFARQQILNIIPAT